MKKKGKKRKPGRKINLEAMEDLSSFELDNPPAVEDLTDFSEEERDLISEGEDDLNDLNIISRVKLF